MSTPCRCLVAALLAVAVHQPGLAATAAAPAPGVARELQWEELVPESERAAYKPGPPPPIHDYLNGFGHKPFGGGGPPSDCKDSVADPDGRCGPASSQLISSSVNQQLDGMLVKLKGYIVPIEVGADGTVTEFFLASYVGACIHVPPPPPNQMVYVKAGRKFAVRSLYDAYAVTGVLRTHSRNNGLIVASYSIEVRSIEHISQ